MFLNKKASLSSFQKNKPAFLGGMYFSNISDCLNYTINGSIVFNISSMSSLLCIVRANGCPNPKLSMPKIDFASIITRDVPRSNSQSNFLRLFTNLLTFSRLSNNTSTFVIVSTPLVHRFMIVIGLHLAYKVEYKPQLFINQ